MGPISTFIKNKYTVPPLKIPAHYVSTPSNIRKLPITDVVLYIISATSHQPPTTSHQPPTTHLNPFFSEFWRERLRDCRCGLARAVEDWFLDWDRDTEARDCDLEADLVGDSEVSRDLEQRGVYTI